VRLAAAIALVLVAVGGSTARAERPAKGAAIGVYEVKYDEVGNSCTQVGMSMAGRGTVTLKNKKGKLLVDIERIPSMLGTLPRADGKINARSKLGPSTIDGLDGQFSVVGRVSDGMLQLVFVAEYFHKRKPYCTQSWNVSGLRQSELDKKRPASAG
jgi:hypothetical protein